MSDLYPIEVDPVALEEDLNDRMHRYLLTSLPINRRFPELRKEATRLLSQPGAIIQGPFLEALPDFPKGSSIKKLVDEGILHPGFSKLNPAVYSRSLHEHQERAIRCVGREKKNVIVATGTGSGKTECFLYPMLDQLLKAGISGKPGVRAIIVYPMNALANDQLYSRLVPVIAKDLAEYGITVGRYTGQTSTRKNEEEMEQDLLQRDRSQFRDLFGDSIPENWLLSRGQMLKTPPHVLVTNYAMLEHLLLLPRNAPLFDGADLRFLVLDEIHMYSGAQATEVALLLRKLRNRYAKDRDIRCIGTSASLGKDEAARSKVIRFASRIFGTEFSELISSERVHHRLLQSTCPTIQFSPAQWISMHGNLNKVRQLPPESQMATWIQGAIEGKAPAPDTGETLPAYLCRLLATDKTVHRLARKVSAGSNTLFREIAQELFPESSSPEALQALKALVSLVSFARETADGFPLLPARYHFFARGIEEATVQLQNSRKCGEQVTDLRFTREFWDENTQNPRYRLLTCRKCGELYFEGHEFANVLTPERTAFSRRAVFWCLPKENAVMPSDSDDQQEEAGAQPVFINLKNGTIKVQLGPEDNAEDWIETIRTQLAEVGENLDGTPSEPLMTTCHACGSSDPDEVITPFHPGDQALSSAICEVLFSHLPTHKDPTIRRKKPGHGRSLLVFSDNRQDAAFFAPNFQRTHEDVLVKRVFLKFLRESGESGSLVQLAKSLSAVNGSPLRYGLTDEAGDRIPASDHDQREEVIIGKLFREFASPGGSRQSLEDLGLVVMHYNHLDFQAASEDTGLPNDLGPNLLRWLLDAMRESRAISMPLGITSHSEFVWGYANQSDRAFVLEGTNPDARFRFISEHRNRFSEMLAEKLELANWKEVLCGFWKSLTDPDEGILKPLCEGGLPRVLSHNRITARLRSEADTLFRCNRCGKIRPYSLRGKCTQWRCGGQTIPVPELEWRQEMERNHYHFLYSKTEVLPSAFAREHTAALSAPLREELEAQFKEKELNILSSSTTMEVGIDLGDLEGVFLRNIPPDVSNYQQRAGRAGRRAQAAPVCITYARNRRYDQDVFEHAGEFLARAPRTPAVHLANPGLFQRHQFSVLMSSLLASKGLGGDGLQIGQLFGLPKFVYESGDLVPEHDSPIEFGEEQEHQFIQSLQRWSQSDSAISAFEQASGLLDCLSPQLTEAEIESLEALNLSLGASFLSALEDLARLFGSRYRHYFEAAVEAEKAHKHKVGARLKSDAKRWASSPIVGFLSKHGLIPSYAFPVDNIELKVMGGEENSANIELNRDARQGIREYAPGAEVVANGRVWKSVGLAHEPRQFMPTFAYKTCSHCRHIESHEHRSLIPQNCSSCGMPLEGRASYHKEPKGFITSAEEPMGKEPSYRRRLAPPTSESQLIANAPEHHFAGTDLLQVQWAYQPAQYGRMIIMNRGKGSGFRNCSCGWTFPVPNGNKAPELTHNNPYTGLPCKKTVSDFRFHLSHTFHTDVLQIRVDFPVPYPNLPEHSNQAQRAEAHEGVARSITESLRLAACKSLEIPEMELSSTYRWRVNGLEIILFDSISGGAGYCKKIFELRASSLFQAAIDHVLTCRVHCSRSCSKCLRTYSNQAYWEAFRRKEALEWVSRVAKLNRENVIVQAGAKHITPKRLDELCNAASKIVLLRQSLGDLCGGFPSDETNGTQKLLPMGTVFPGWAKIQKWLSAGSNVQICYGTGVNFQDPTQERAFRMAEVFLPLVREGTLSLLTGSFDPAGPLAILVEEAKGIITLLYSTEFIGTALEELWPQDVLAKEEPIQSLEKFLPAQLEAVLPDALKLPPGVNRYYYKVNEPRQWERDFGFLREQPPRSIEVIDRYLFAENFNVEALQNLLEQFAGLWKAKPERITLTYGPARNFSDAESWRNAAFVFARDLLKDPRFDGIIVRPVARDHRGPKGDKHDRRILIHGHAQQGIGAANENGAPAMPRARRRPAEANVQATPLIFTAELTGGVSNLADLSCETTVFTWTS